MRAEEKSRYSSWWVVTPTQLNEKDDGGCILHLKKKKVFLFLPDNIGLFPRAHPTSVSLLWGEDEVTNVGQAIRAPCWSSYLGHREIWHLYPPCWLCPHPSYLLHRQEGGSIPAFGESTSEATWALHAAPANKPTDVMRGGLSCLTLVLIKT